MKKERKRILKESKEDSFPKVAHHLEFETIEELEDFREGVILGRLIGRCMAENKDWRPFIKELKSLVGKKETTGSL